ncbi:MAG: prolipoprotein diacylglyceryl transferase family protein [Acidobacteriaceae bacterium]
MALSSAGKVLYGAVFLVAVPAVLIAWAAETRSIVGLPAVRSLPLGVSLGCAGLALMLFGMRDLRVYGRGLPMNADPPPDYVTRGSYRLLPHPIYTGFSLLCVGVSIGAGSGSGLWLVSPIVILSCAALVLGYECHDLRRRFGRMDNNFLPAPAASSPARIEVARCWLSVVVPWTFLCVPGILGHPRGPELSLDAFVIAALALAPAFAPTRQTLRSFSISGLAAMPIAFALFLALPLAFPARAFAGPQQSGLWVFVPSPEIVAAFLAANLYAKRWPSLKWLFGTLAILAAAGVLLARPGGLLDALAAILTAAVAVQIASVWRMLREGTEHLANSWKEWRCGAVRVINHGFYAGMGGLLAVLVCGVLASPRHLAAVLVAAISAVFGAALWAQYVEGSAQLLRPYGFYGGLLGGTIGAWAAPLFHTSPWMVLAVFSVSGPWAQALGRLRCLVQGCCHGSPAPPNVGVRYLHPRSRVCRFTSWTNVPLHPTPLYSILWNTMAGLLLVRIWTLHAALSLIIGLYFILSGIGRFAEEGWRGEPQTSVVARLRLYQWAAIASVLLGILFSAVGDRAAAPAPEFNWSVVAAAVIFGLFVSFAMGVDFPESTRRFSRLT